MEAVAEVVQKRETPEAATFLGEGRLAEGRMLCINLGAECAGFDAELSGSQIRNLEEQMCIRDSGTACRCPPARWRSPALSPLPERLYAGWSRSYHPMSGARPLQGPAAVSYTHLDVYKRQAC